MQTHTNVNDDDSAASRGTLKNIISAKLSKAYDFLVAQYIVNAENNLDINENLKNRGTLRTKRWGHEFYRHGPVTSNLSQTVYSTQNIVKDQTNYKIKASLQNTYKIEKDNISGSTFNVTATPNNVPKPPLPTAMLQQYINKVVDQKLEAQKQESLLREHKLKKKIAKLTALQEQSFVRDEKLLQDIALAITSQGGAGSYHIQHEESQCVYDALIQIWNFTNRTSSKALDAERMAMQAVQKYAALKHVTLRKFDEIETTLGSQGMHIHRITKQLCELGPAFLYLQHKAKKEGNYCILSDALRALDHANVALFLDTYVALIEENSIVNVVLKSKKLRFNIGLYGLASDFMVALLEGFPLPGLSFGAKTVQVLIEQHESNKIVSASKNFVGIVGTFSNKIAFATGIASIILKYNGHLISQCTKSEVEDLAQACLKVTIKIISKINTEEQFTTAEDVAHAILCGAHLKDASPIIRRRLVAVDNDSLKDDRYSNETSKHKDWVVDIIQEYCKRNNVNLGQPRPNEIAYLLDRNASFTDNVSYQQNNTYRCFLTS